MTLQVHVAASPDTLADALADLLADVPEDPFARELVVVPARGVERWLSQRLSHRLGAARGDDGVTAGVEFATPWSLTATLAGKDRRDPWRPERLTWSVLAAIDELLGSAATSSAPAWARPLLGHLGAGAGAGGDTDTADLRRARRWATASRLAGLFSSYALQRPALIADWRDGGSGDGLGDPLPPDLGWQPELWRLVHRQLVDAGVDDPAGAQAEAVAALIAPSEDLPGPDLPTRLSIFGHTRFARTELDLIVAAGVRHDVHLWLPVSSPVAWARLSQKVAAGPLRRAEDRSARIVRHPLLRALGRDVRELQRSIVGVGDNPQVEVLEPPSTEAGGADASLLDWLRSDLRQDVVPDAVTRRARTVTLGDTRLPSVGIHACHGLGRQVEVLREVLLGLLADDPTLEPRDIIVMCPDIEAVAPLAMSVFGLAGGRSDRAGVLDHGPGSNPGGDLRIALADRGLASTNPLLALAADLLDLGDGRATVTQVLTVLDSAPVRRRFRFDDELLVRLRTWVVDAGVRWGLHAADRDEFGLPGLTQNTWRSGLDRLLLGVAMAESDGPWQGTVPLDDVTSADLDLVGRLVEAVARIGTAVDGLTSDRTLEEWVEHLTWAVEALGLPERDAEWQAHELREEFADLRASVGTSDATEVGDHASPVLSLPEMRSLLSQRLAPRPTRASFRTGSITFCTLVPMRAVPHRVVCLVGLDDGRYPRRPSTDGDDVLARSPVTGERDARAEDRQLLLDAVAAAGERLVITYSGHDERSGAPRPPAVPLGDLLDALDTTAAAQGADGSEVAVRSLITWHHPLQPVDPRNFTPGGLGEVGTGAGPFSFDTAAAHGARAWVGDRRPPQRWSSVRLPEREPAARATTALKELQDFFAHPVRAFVRQRLDIALPERVEELPEALPVDLDALAQWQLGDRMLRGVLAGSDPSRVTAAELVRGDLPPGRLGLGQLERIEQHAGLLFRTTEPLRGREAHSVDIDVVLPDGRRVTGVVRDMRGSQLVRISYASLGPQRRLATWIDLLALTASDPDHALSAVTVGKHAAGPRAARISPVAEEAADLLQDLLDVREEGLCAPLPLHPKLAWAWLEENRRQTPSRFTARRAWFGEFGSSIPGLAEDPAHQVVYGPDAHWRTVQGRASAGESWHPEATSRLGQYAWRVWQPLMAREKVGPA